MTSPASTQPAAVWKALAREVAAPGRTRMRVWSPETDKFSHTAPLRASLPTRPAAVHLYTNRRTQLLPMDFDTKRGSQAAVDADVAQAINWITQCGGVTVTDRSTSGGRHLLVPLAIGTSASVDEITLLMRLLAARLPTLDITPNLNPTQGCITPPGSPCKQGGYRILDGPLDAARDAFATRSTPDLLPRLYVLLGALSPTPTTPPGTSLTETPTAATIGDSDDLRLAPAHVRHDPLPPAVHDFATRGIHNTTDRTWPTPSEARMSVITHAVWRGHTITSITALIAPGRPWHDGLGAAYQRYHHHAPAALTRDFTKAITWLTANLEKDRPPQHKNKYPQGGTTGGHGSEQLRNWLANGCAWADREFRGQRYRWTVQAVLQTLAVHAARAGQVINGTPVVGVGGRALSLASGLLSPDTIWRVLRDLRDRPGSPVTQVRSAIGVDADWYALTSQNKIETDPIRLQRARIEDVHPAWHVLGHQHRRVYELIAYHAVTNRADLYSAARLSKSTVNATIVELTVAGLIKTTGRGTVAPGPTSLDDIATAHHLDDITQSRIAEYRAERQQWRTWLEARDTLMGRTTPGASNTAPVPSWAPRYDEPIEQAYLESVLSTGPPPEREDNSTSPHTDAIALIGDILGGRILNV